MSISPTSIYLTWALPLVPGLEEEYQYYLINCDEVMTSQRWTLFTVEPHATIISLHPYYEYNCRVAIVGNATYPYSAPITLLTDQAGIVIVIVCNRSCYMKLAPNAAPQNPSQSIVSSTTLNFTWSPPPSEHKNGIITHYVITVTEVDTGVTLELTSNTTWLYLDYLHPYYTYIFRFAAVTVAQGPFSSGYNVIMPEDGTLYYTYCYNCVNLFF